MTDVVRAIILGIVEGLTEFLPVSSTGHMILVEPLLRIPPEDSFWSAFVIFIQIGAILAVVVYFWRRLWRLTFPASKTPLREHLIVKLVVAFLPAAVLGKLAGDFIEARLEHPLPVAVALIAGGAAILLIERFFTRPTVTDAAAITLRQAFWIGCAQCVAMWPGVSRSAATIMGGLVIGLSTAAAAEFSFFLAIPTMFAAGFYKVYRHRHDIHDDQMQLLAIGFVVSFVVAWVVVAAFMRYIQTHTFRPFAYYRIALGLAVIALLGQLSY